MGAEMFENYEDLKDWCLNHDNICCRCKSKPVALERLACPDCDQIFKSRCDLSSFQDYLAFANELEMGFCGGCEGQCPAQDYLCSSCRSK